MEETERIQTNETTAAAGGVSGEYSAAEVEDHAILRIRSFIGGCIGVCLLACSVSFFIESCIDFVQ